MSKQSKTIPTTITKADEAKEAKIILTPSIITLVISFVSLVVSETTDFSKSTLYSIVKWRMFPKQE